MPWLQIRLESNPEHCAQLEDALLAAGAVAVTMEDLADQPLFEPPPGETPLWQHTRLTGLFNADCDTDQIIQIITHEFKAPLPVYRCEILEDKDWEREWMRHYHPMQFGDRLWVCPSWTPPPEPDAVNLMLDPGLAFGTGTHPTTALCLRWLDSQILEKKILIDYGCGSGILAIAALLLGAEHVFAIDNDPQALTATLDNASRNNIGEDKITVLSPEQAQEQMPTDLSADILIANILAGPLVSLQQTISNLLKQNGSLCMSGILDTQVDQLLQAYQAQFDFTPLAQEDEWVRLSARKR